jgi:repressor LexA
MLRVRGESMIDAGILPGDFVVARQQEEAKPGEMIVAGIPGEVATVKIFGRVGNKVELRPANATMEPMRFDPAEVRVFGKVVTIIRRI